MTTLKINQEITVRSTLYKVVALTVEYDDSEHPAFLAVRFIKSRNAWSTVIHSLRYENLRGL